MESGPNCLLKASLYSFPAVVLAIAGSVYFLDEPIALAIDRVIRSNALLVRYTNNIPDILLPLVLLLSAGMWIAYTRRVRRGILDERTRFHRIAGTSLPAAFLLKTALKFAFGRISTRAWLEDPAAHAFLWFGGRGAHSGFPSGHMAVFAVLAAAAWIFFPRTRSFSMVVLLTIGSALVLTDYHFLADVIAGAYIGWVTVAVTCRALERRTA